LGERSVLVELYAQRKFDEGWAQYRSLKATGETGAAEHLAGARCARGRGDLFAARWAIGLAQEANPTGSLLGQIRFTHGLILREIGEFNSAVQCFMACIQGMWEYPELAPVMEGPAYYNLGLAYRQTRRYTEARQAYEEAAARFRPEHMTESLCMTLHNLAWVACLVNDPSTARTALAESQPLCGTEEFRIHQTIGEAFLASLGDETDRHRAIEICDGLTKGGHVPDQVRSHAYWLAGKVALGLGQHDLAESLARHGLEWGTKAQDDNRCLHDAADLLREIRQQQLSPKPSGA